MPTDLAQLLQQTIDRELPELRAVADERAACAPKAGAWSPKQELGHLIDSAANNHIRFVVASLEGEFRCAGYAQDEWVDAHGYQDFAWTELVNLWYSYNSLLAHLVGRVGDERLENRCVVGSSAVTLRFLIEDYVLHMQHHLDHVLSRANATRYPAV